MTLTCILVDDEPKALTSLSYELKKFEDRIRILRQFSDTGDAAEFLREKAVDVVFLDINMPNIDGMKFVELFPERNFEVIFTTAHSDYAIEAIRKNAIDYLVKPIDSDDLETVLLRLEKIVEKSSFSSKIVAAIDRLNTVGIGPKKIKFSVDKKIVFIEPNSIIYCESDGNYCKVILEDNKELFLTQKLKQVAELIPDDLFYRVHNSYLINLSKVKEFHKNEGYIVLDHNIKIPVSRQKRNEVLDRL